MYKKSLPTSEYLNFYFRYEPTTGDLFWRVRYHQGCAKGAIGPSGTNHGYRVVCLHRRIYLQHRIIWKMMTGGDPDPTLAMDHINEDVGDNRWVNLRQITVSENVSRSSKHRRVDTLQVWQSAGGKWCARINHPAGGYTNIGTFDTRAEALAADGGKPFVRPDPKMQARKTRYGTWEARIWDPELKRKVHVGTYPTRELALKACKK